MKYFASVNPEDQPRVLGLTASVVNGKVKPYKIEQAIVELERTLKASCETSSDQLVEKYATKPEENSLPIQQRWGYEPKRNATSKPTPGRSYKPVAGISS